MKKEDFPETLISALNYWICEYVSKLRMWLGYDEEPEEILDIILRNRRNSFLIGHNYDTNNAYAMGLCISPSLFNHSCDPNVCFTFAIIDNWPPYFTYTSKRTISSGSELCISYIENLYNPFEVRQAELLENYLFNCTCLKCIEENVTLSHSK